MAENDITVEKVTVWHQGKAREFTQAQFNSGAADDWIKSMTPTKRFERPKPRQEKPRV